MLNLGQLAAGDDQGTPECHNRSAHPRRWQMCRASTVFLPRRFQMPPNVRQARPVTGCRSLRITQLLAAPWRTWTRKFRKWPISFGESGYLALYRLQQNMALVVAVRHPKEVGNQTFVGSIRGKYEIARYGYCRLSEKSPLNPLDPLLCPIDDCS